MPPGYVFKPGRVDGEAFRKPLAVHDLSLVGAALSIDGSWSLDELDKSLVSGALVDPRGRSITTRMMVVRTLPHGGNSLLGVSFRSMGLHGIRRLGRWIEER